MSSSALLRNGGGQRESSSGGDDVAAVIEHVEASSDDDVITSRPGYANSSSGGDDVAAVIEHVEASLDDVAITSRPGYADAVKRINLLCRTFRELPECNTPRGFPNATQHATLVRLNLGLDVILSYKTDGGKTEIFLKGPFAVGWGVTLVVVPLNTILHQHVASFVKSGYPPSRVLQLTHSNAKEIAQMLDGLGSGSRCPPLIVLGHVEAFVGALLPLVSGIHHRRARHVSLLVIDEAQVIIEWGSNFRPQYRKLHLLRRVAPKLRVLAVSGSLNAADRQAVGAAFNNNNNNNNTE